MEPCPSLGLLQPGTGYRQGLESWLQMAGSLQALASGQQMKALLPATTRPPAWALSPDPRRAQQIDICRFKQEVEAAEDFLFVPAFE